MKCLTKYLYFLILAVFLGCTNVTAQHLESYGLSIGGNNTWLQLDSNSIVDEKEKNTGLNFGTFALWDSPTIGQLKAQLEFAHKEFVFRRGPRENSFGRQIGHTNYFSEFNYVSLLIAPIFHLSALKLDDYYVLAGAKLDFIWSSKIEIQEESSENKAPFFRDTTPDLGNRFAYSGSLGIGGNLFEVSGKSVGLECRFNVEISESISGLSSFDVRNRSLELWIVVQL